MKVDLRNNMLDKDSQAEGKKTSKAWGNFFSGKKSKKDKVIQKEKKQEFKKIEGPEFEYTQNNQEVKKVVKTEKKAEIKMPIIGNGEQKSKTSGLNVVDNNYLSTEEINQRIIQDGKIIGEATFQEPKVHASTIQPDFQNNYQYTYEQSSYVNEFPEKVIIKWQGPDYEIYPKSKKWYTVMGFILAGLIGYAIFTNSPLTAIVFILIGIVGYMYLEREPQLTDFAISYDGVVVGSEVYDWDDISSFWIFYDPPHTRIISLQMKGKLMPYIHIPLHQIDPVELREKMMEFIPETKQEQGFIDVLERVLHM